MGSSEQVRVDVGADKGSAATRADRARSVKTAAPKSPVYQNDPEVKATCDAVVTAGAKVETAEQKVKDLELACTQARDERDAAIVAFDAVYGVCVSRIELAAPTAAEVHGLGFLVRERNSYMLAPPVAIVARYDADKKQIRVQIHHAPGMGMAVTEICLEGTEPQAWNRLPGIGSRPVVPNPAPGTYLVRAASVRASEQSEFTEPVTVTVR